MLLLLMENTMFVKICFKIISVITYFCIFYLAPSTCIVCQAMENTIETIFYTKKFKYTLHPLTFKSSVISWLEGRRNDLPEENFSFYQSHIIILLHPTNAYIKM